MIWQWLLAKVRIVWGEVFQDSKREAIIYDDCLVKFDTTWGGNDTFSHDLH